MLKVEHRLQSGEPAVEQFDALGDGLRRQAFEQGQPDAVIAPLEIAQGQDKRGRRRAGGFGPGGRRRDGGPGKSKKPLTAAAFHATVSHTFER